MEDDGTGSLSRSYCAPSHAGCASAWKLVGGTSSNCHTNGGSTIVARQDAGYEFCEVQVKGERERNTRGHRQRAWTQTNARR
jgi:hypothetical protein